jgi:hypothetical protein
MDASWCVPDAPRRDDEKVWTPLALDLTDCQRRGGS